MWWALALAAVFLGRFFWPPMIRAAADTLGTDPEPFCVLGWAPTGLGMILLAAAPAGDEAFRRRPWTWLLGACLATTLLQLGLLRLGPRLTGGYADALLAYVLGMYAAWAVVFTVLPAYLAVAVLTARKRRRRPLATIARGRPCRMVVAVSELAVLLTLVPWAERAVAGWN